MNKSSVEADALPPWPDFDDPDRYFDERDYLEPGELPPEPDTDMWASGEAHEAAAHALEGVTVGMRILTSDQYAGIAAVLRDAAETPDPWVGPDPTLNPDWVDPRERSVAAVRRERRTIAVRSAAADLAVRLHMSENMVHARAAHAETLQKRCPRLWTAFRAGWVVEQNAVNAAQLAMTLPDDQPEAWAAFDAQVHNAASSLPPGKFRLRARVARERVHPESIDQRHRRAAADRDVWLTPELDALSSVAGLVPAAKAQAAYERLDATARHLADQPGEDRTLAQLRADAFCDLLTYGRTEQFCSVNGGAAVAITVPVMTLLGHDDTPATLDGYGPIDTDTARRLAGEASSWVRILTHPVTGTVLDVDRTTYRVPTALRRWLGVRDPVCVFPGCARSARKCQIDHRLEWQYGGTTSATNTAPLCEPHHVLKTESNWKLERDADTGASWWVTPTALDVDVDPPPW